MLPLILGYGIDMIIGDPQGFPHPVRLIGNFISFMERNLRRGCRNEEDERKAGMILWFSAVGASFIVPLAILLIASRISGTLALIVESIMCYYILATKSLKDESMKVYLSLKDNNLQEARRNLSYIVGRDVDKLDEGAIARAAVETVAENTSDGVIAPMLYILIGGAPLGFMYKAVNTLDSMVGYKNKRYINMGRFSAIADDVANYIPARLSAYIMVAAAFILNMDYRKALEIYRRDRYNHKSPNSAHTEAVSAGALNIMLGGDNYYGGVLVPKPSIGDPDREVEAEDIRRVNRLMNAASILCLFIGIVIKIIVR
ncbi:MAG TPA: cobalamin biosynthesis protein CobD [Clostridiales bacterium]|nr:cobalamin biosynthesis protein CobD [Clostridiales bacterium]